MNGVTVIGWTGTSLRAQARAALAHASHVFAARSFAPLASQYAPHAVFTAFEPLLAELPAQLEALLAQHAQPVVAVSGDPMFHSVASRIVAALGRERVHIVPEVSSVQLACARLGVAWDAAAIVSAHGKGEGAWSHDNAPHHPLRPVVQAAAQRNDRPVIALTAPGNGPEAIAAALRACGVPPDAWRVHVAARLGQTDEALWYGLTLEETAELTFPQPNVCVLVPDVPMPAFSAMGLADEAYLQRQPEKGLITKREVRALSLALLAPTATSVLWDIGAGSGSVGLEAARLAADGAVWAFEKNDADVAIALENARRFRAWNWTIRHARAPEGLEEVPDPDAVFIGGSGGELEALLRLCWQRLRPNGRLVANFVTLENLATATATLSALGAAWQVTQLWAARSKPILEMHRLAAENPVWLLWANKP